jgi:hypothetical protein
MRQSGAHPRMPVEIRHQPAAGRGQQAPVPAAEVRRQPIPIVRDNVGSNQRSLSWIAPYRKL